MKPTSDVLQRIKDPALKKRLGRLHQTLHESPPRESSPKLSRKAEVIQLPQWPEMFRGVPNGVLRSALFGAIKKGPRRLMEREPIHAQDGITIYYTGARLDQGDLDVWEAVLHFARLQGLGDECRVTAYQLLKAMGKRDTGGNRTVLEKRLSRLKANGVDIHIARYGYEGSLIDEVYRDKATAEYVIRLNPKLSLLFAADQFTQIDWAVRRALDGKPLAQWLHGFYATHADPYPIKIETLHKLCGSETVDLWKYAQMLRKALDDVAKASQAHGQKFSHETHGGLVNVEKKASKSQQRHLAKKKTKPRKPVS